MKIILIGSNGQLGTDISISLGSKNIIPLTHSDIDITDFTGSYKAVRSIKPSLIINTAAYHKVDECEKNPLTAFAVNAAGASNLAVIARELNCDLLHVSTDYVFDGRHKIPYAESDEVNPLNVYGLSKALGETLIMNYLKKYYIVRTAGLYGASVCRAKGGNFIDLMLKLHKEKKEIKVVDDQFISVTYTKDLADKIAELLKTGKYGLYHITNEGGCSWHEFASRVFEFSGIETTVKKAGSGEFPSRVKRPGYSILKNQRLKEAGMEPMRRWEDALKDFIETRLKCRTG